MSYAADNPMWPFWSAIVRARRVCAGCKGRFDPSELHADHKIRRPFGPDTLDNLQALCRSCHGRKTAAEAPIYNAPSSLVAELNQPTPTYDLPPGSLAHSLYYGGR